LDLPTPERWKHPRDLVLVYLVGGVVVSGFCAGWIVQLLVRGDYLTAGFAAGLLVYMATFTAGFAMVSLNPGKVRRVLTSEPGGTIFRPSRVWVRSIVLSTIAALVSGIIFVCYVPSGRLGIPFEGLGYSIGVAWLVCWLTYLLLRGWSKGWGHLKLSPDGFELASVAGPTASGAWDDVLNVIDEAPKGKVSRCPAVMVMKDVPPQVINGLQAYPPDGNTIYWAIRHYWLHPENRGELASGRAVERLWAQEFEVE